ncbi:MAG TPA: ABC transporter ATP-binding protein [Enteractinococcus sp.]
MNENVLEVRNVTLRFGGVVALDSISFNVKKDELFSILGPNGAGKTSLFNCLSGLETPDGSIRAFGKELVGRKPHEIAALGVGRTFQNLGLFNSMTVAENLLVGAHQQIDGGAFLSAIRWPSTFRSERSARQRVAELMIRMDLAQYRDTVVETLPYGIRKRVEIGKALASNPSLLLLDEPVAGMNHDESRQFMDYVQTLKADLGLTIILIEHDISLMMQLSDRVLALDFGKHIGTGTPTEIQENKRVIAAYLGSLDDETTANMNLHEVPNG